MYRFSPLRLISRKPTGSELHLSRSARPLESDRRVAEAHRSPGDWLPVSSGAIIDGTATHGGR